MRKTIIRLVRLKCFNARFTVRVTVSSTFLRTFLRALSLTCARITCMSAQPRCHCHNVTTTTLLGTKQSNKETKKHQPCRKNGQQQSQCFGQCFCLVTCLLKWSQKMQLFACLIALSEAFPPSMQMCMFSPLSCTVIVIEWLSLFILLQLGPILHWTNVVCLCNHKDLAPSLPMLPLESKLRLLIWWNTNTTEHTQWNQSLDMHIGTIDYDNLMCYVDLKWAKVGSAIVPWLVGWHHGHWSHHLIRVPDRQTSVFRRERSVLCGTLACVLTS